jgi:hypothetical protein
MKNELGKQISIVIGVIAIVSAILSVYAYVSDIKTEQKVQQVKIETMKQDINIISNELWDLYEEIYTEK